MWPSPPYNDKIPSIPDSYKIFNIAFKVENNFPILSDYKEEPFDIEELKIKVKESVSTYISILKKLAKKQVVTNDLKKLSEVHQAINKYINNAKDYECQQQIETLIQNKFLKDKETVEELDLLTNRKRWC